LVVVVKMTLLLTFSAYRGMWRYIGVADLVNLSKITLLSSLILFFLVPVAAIMLRGVIIPRSVLVIDFLLFTFLLIGSRLSFAALNESFVRLQSRWQPRVLIIGAGDLGELVVRSVLRARPAACSACARVAAAAAWPGRSWRFLDTLMAVPAVAGRRAQRLSVSSEVAPRTAVRIRRIGRGYAWIVILLAAVALFSRVYTTNSLA